SPGARERATFRRQPEARLARIRPVDDGTKPGADQTPDFPGPSPPRREPAARLRFEYDGAVRARADRGGLLSNSQRRNLGTASAEGADARRRAEDGRFEDVGGSVGFARDVRDRPPD